MADRAMIREMQPAVAQRLRSESNGICQAARVCRSRQTARVTRQKRFETARRSARAQAVMQNGRTKRDGKADGGKSDDQNKGAAFHAPLDMVVEAEHRRQANENGKDNDDAGPWAMTASQIAPLMVKQRARGAIKPQTKKGTLTPRGRTRDARGLAGTKEARR